MRFVVPTDDPSTWNCHGWVPDLVDKRDKYKVYSITPRGYLNLVLKNYMVDEFPWRQRSVEFILQAIGKGECFARRCRHGREGQGHSVRWITRGVIVPTLRGRSAFLASLW
jgi:hypothetical protein